MIGADRANKNDARSLKLALSMSDFGYQIEAIQAIGRAGCANIKPVRPGRAHRLVESSGLDDGGIPLEISRWFA